MISPAMSRAAALAVNRDRPGREAMLAIWQAARTAGSDDEFARAVAGVLPGLAAAQRPPSASAVAVVVKGGRFDPALHPRDDRGRWGHGGGGGKALPGGVTAAIDRNLARWDAGGGYPIPAEPLSKGVVSHMARRVDQLGKKLRKKADRDRWAADKGVQFTRFALDSSNHVPGTRVHVALDSHAGISGAVSFYEHEEDGERFIHVDYLGTTGSAPGAGTALAHAVAKYAAARGLGVMGEPENPGADAFWAKLGWHPDPLDLGATTFAGWTAAEAKEVASRG